MSDKAKSGSNKNADASKKESKKGRRSKSADKGTSKKKSMKENIGDQTINQTTAQQPTVDKDQQPAVNNASLNMSDPSSVAFEAGQIFSKYDLDKDGKLDKQEFTQMIRQNPEILHNPSDRPRVVGNIPVELISNRVLTHFDETAGVAISRWEVDQHKNMGNIVTPLTDAYKSRYENLRGLLTGKLLPKREHLLQLRRQLQSCSVEVDAKRRGIERETLADTESILERLRSVESMRQASIKHQVLQIEEELQTIERVVKRVEQANIDDSDKLNHSGVLLTSANPGVVPVESIRAPRAVGMVELIHEFGDLHSSINRLSLKPITVQVDFPTDDFPRETAERLEVVSRCDKYLHALSVKDHLLWLALQDKDKAEETLSEERRLCQEYGLEIANWAEMTQKLSQQVLALKHENEKLQLRNRDIARIMRDHNIYYEEKT